MDKTFYNAKVFDQLAALEIEIRGAGAWCHVTKDFGDVHYFIARNEKSSLAISLCRQYIKPIQELSIVVPDKKCFVCSCFAHSRETLLNQAERVERIQASEEQKQLLKSAK